MLSAIVLAAGRGKRLRNSVEKPLVKINGKPLIIFSLEAFERHPEIDEVIVVCSRQNKAKINKILGSSSFKKISGIALGGARRQDSVFNGLKKISPKSSWVLIHDSARPFIDRGSVTEVIRQAKAAGAAILAVPVKATVKSCRNGQVIKTLDRSGIWEVQTPQVYKKELILKAYARFSRSDVTDDASLVEKLGKKVRVAVGKYENIKITTPVDLLLAESILKRLK